MSEKRKRGVTETFKRVRRFSCSKSLYPYESLRPQAHDIGKEALFFLDKETASGNFNNPCLAPVCVPIFKQPFPPPDIVSRELTSCSSRCYFIIVFLLPRVSTKSVPILTAVMFLLLRASSRVSLAY